MPEIKIQGIVFELPDLYSPGHTLDAGEARALNQLRRENIRNAFTAKVKAAKAAGLDEETLNQMFADYADAYRFSTHVGERSSGNKLDSIMRQLAREAVKAVLTAKGNNWDDYDANYQEIMVATMIQKRPAIREEALERLRQIEAMSDAMLEEAGDGET